MKPQKKWKDVLPFVSFPSAVGTEVPAEEETFLEIEFLSAVINSILKHVNVRPCAVNNHSAIIKAKH